MKEYWQAYEKKTLPGENMKTALLFGASGFVGSFLLHEMLDSPGYGQITAVVRKPLGFSHPKLKVLVGDSQSLSGLRKDLEGEEVFIAVGTTKKKTPDRGEYYRIDHDYPVLAAAAAKERGAKSLLVVSAVGANPGSGVFYTRTKGEMERDLIALDFEHTHIFRPSIIMGERPEKRPLEKLLIGACSLLNPLLLGSLRRYRGIKAEEIARAMLRAAARPAAKLAVYEWEAMKALQ